MTITLAALPTGLLFDNSYDFVSPYTLLRTVCAVVKNIAGTSWYALDGEYDVPLTDPFPADQILIAGPFTTRAEARNNLALPGERSQMDANGTGAGISTWLTLL